MQATLILEKMAAWSFHLRNLARFWSTRVRSFDNLICKHSLTWIETFIAKIGGGQRLGNVAEGLYKQGKRAIPHGTCPSVGVAGHALHGGYGYDSRKWGLGMWIPGVNHLFTRNSFCKQPRARAIFQTIF